MIKFSAIWLTLLTLLTLSNTNAPAQKSQELGAPITVSGTAQKFYDVSGSGTLYFGVIVKGSPNSYNVSIQGCMNGVASCSVLGSASGVTSSTIGPINGGWDYIEAIPTWVGGTNVSFTINKTGLGFSTAGVAGPQGAKGDTGDVGPQGVAGPIGSQGLQGDIGPQGAVGLQGIQGVQGLTGPQGAPGLTGPKGDTGPQGIQGIPGPQGPGGAPAVGPTFSPQIQSSVQGQLAAQPNTTTNAIGGVVQTATVTPNSINSTNYTEANTFTYNWLSNGQEANGAQTEQNTFAYYNNYFGLGFSQQPWSVEHDTYLQSTKYRSGIMQGWYGQFTNLAVGDMSPFYAYSHCHSGLSASSDEGCEGLSSQVDFMHGGAGTVTATLASPTALSFTAIDGYGPGGGIYLLRESGSQLAYVSSTVAHTNGSTSEHPWTQYVTLTTSPAGAAFTIPGGQSTAMGVVTATSDDNAYSVPVNRTVTVSLNSAVAGGAAFIAGPVCLSGGYIDTGTISAPQSVSSGSQTFTLASSEKLFVGSEVWQGGPCGYGMGELNGRTLAAAQASHDITALPIAGSPSPGVIALSSAFTGGQQGPGYGYAKQDFNVGVDPANGADAITFSKATDGSGGNLLSSYLDLTQLLTPIPDTSAGLSLVSVNLVTNVSGWNFSPYHDSTDTFPFQRVVGQSYGPGLASNNSMELFSGNPPNTSAVGHVEYRGFDYIYVARMVKIASVESKTNNTFSLLLYPNNLPALNAGEVFDVANYWREGGRQARFVTSLSNANLRIPANSDIIGQDISCLHGGICLSVTSGYDNTTPAGAGLFLNGYQHDGIDINQPIQSPGATGIPAAIRVGCYFGDCSKAPSSVYDIFNTQMQGANIYHRVNTQAGNYTINDDFLGGPVIGMIRPGTTNPFTLQGLTQTVDPNGSQSLISTHIWNAPGYGFTSPSSNYIFSSKIGAIDTQYADTVGKVGMFPVQDKTNSGGFFLGSFDAVFHSAALSTFNGISVGVLPPQPVDTSVSGHTPFSVTSSAPCNGSITPNCYYDEYDFSAVTSLGESALASGTSMQLAVGNSALSASNYNTITVPNYAQEAGVIGYGVYVAGNDPAGGRFLGYVALGGTLIDKGQATVPQPNGAKGFNSASMSSAIYTGQVRLPPSHGIRWQTNTEVNGPSDAGLNRTAAGTITVDGSNEGDALGTIKAGNVISNGIAVVTAPGTNGTCTVPVTSTTNGTTTSYSATFNYQDLVIGGTTYHIPTCSTTAQLKRPSYKVYHKVLKHRTTRR